MRVYAMLLVGIAVLCGVLVMQLQNMVTPVQANTEIYRYFDKKQLTCLHDNIYHEARNQPIVGQMAVMYVTLNRVDDHRFPDTICEVVMQGPHRPSWKNLRKLVPIRHQCHFSWYCDGKSDEVTDQAAYDAIRYMVNEILMGSVKIFDITEGATHYHADYVSPSWANTKTKTVEIEDHIFYRWESN